MSLERYVIRGGRAGYERLQVLARAWMPTTSALFDIVGLRPDMRCVDLGSGSGDVTFEIARRLDPSGHVTGLDMDEIKLDLAREAARQQGLPNVDFRVINVNDWNESDAYDLVYCRFLLEHLKRPVDLLRRMWGALRSGGIIVVEETDFEGAFSHPPNEAFDFQTRTFIQVVEHNGGDLNIGRKLYWDALQAGISDPNIKLVQRVETAGEAKALPLLTLEATADPIIAAGIANSDEVGAALEELARYLVDPTTVIGSPRVFQLWARR